MSSTTVSLLLVADSAETCERIASALLSAPALYRVERVTSAELNRREVPRDIRLALVDQDLEAARQAQVVERLASAGIAVVALVDPSDVKALQEVVLAGAAALVAKPFVDTQLWDTVGQALATGLEAVVQRAAGPGPRRRQKGLLIALYGPKGGSGTSVVAANLAVALQQRSQRGAVLVEAGEGASSQAVLLNLRAEHTMGDLLAQFDPEDDELLNAVLAPHHSGLRVLLPPPSQSLRVPLDILEELLKALQRRFDFVVVDVQAEAKASCLTIMRQAHGALVVMVPEMTSLHYSKLFVETIEKTLPEVALNLILNRATMEGGVPAEAIRKHLKLRIAHEIPDDQALVTASVNKGVPFVISHPRSSLARAIQKLAAELSPETRQSNDGRLLGLGRLVRQAAAR